MENLSEEEIAEFREIFSLVDKDGGGSITGDELGELMDTLGIEASPEEIASMIAEVSIWINQQSFFFILFEPHSIITRLMQMEVAKLTSRSL